MKERVLHFEELRDGSGDGGSSGSDDLDVSTKLIGEFGEDKTVPDRLRVITSKEVSLLGLEGLLEKPSADEVAFFDLRRNLVIDALPHTWHTREVSGLECDDIFNKLGRILFEVNTNTTRFV